MFFRQTNQNICCIHKTDLIRMDFLTLQHFSNKRIGTEIQRLQGRQSHTVRINGKPAKCVSIPTTAFLKSQWVECNFARWTRRQNATRNIATKATIRNIVFSQMTSLIWRLSFWAFTLKIFSYWYIWLNRREGCMNCISDKGTIMVVMTVPIV